MGNIKKGRTVRYLGKTYKVKGVSTCPNSDVLYVVLNSGLGKEIHTTSNFVELSGR